MSQRIHIFIWVGIIGSDSVSAGEILDLAPKAMPFLTGPLILYKGVLIVRGSWLGFRE